MDQASGPEGARLPEFLAGGGAMGALMRSLDWTKTPLGPVESWPQSLRTSVSTCLNCAFPILVWWGPQLVMLYNDEYRMMLGSAKHPSAMGAPGAKVWPEIWDVIGPMLAQVVEGREAARARDLLLLMDRHGYTEETYFSFSYSPIHDETGGIGGVFCPVIETTEKVIGERRLRTLRDLAAGSTAAGNVEEVCRVAADVLAANPQDVPFALIYLVEADGTAARLAAAAGVEAGAPVAPRTLDLPAGAGTLWPLRADAMANAVVDLAAVAGAPGALPTGAWLDPPVKAMVLPITLPGQARARAFLIAAASPRRPFDDDYATFFDLIASQIATGLADAHALDEERKRAEALAEIDRAKTAFFSNVSHEFRTPLTLTLGPLEEVLAAWPEAERAQERGWITVAHRNGLRLLKLVNTLLDFARIEAGRAVADYRPTDLAALTAELAANFRSAVDKAGLRLIVDCQPLPEPAYVDRDMWEKIVLNLLSNAFKFTFDGEIGVTLRPSPDRSAAILSIRDTGIGIAGDKLPHLFERFHRVEGARGRSIEGSGIGLALVQELVRLHGGTIDVTSEPNRGSTFTIAIPFGNAHLPADRVGAEPGNVSTGVRARIYVEEALRWLPDGRQATEPMDRPFLSAPDDLMADGAPAAVGQRVVLADDNADMRDYVHRLLTEQGYEVETVPDGEAALAALRRRPPDLLLSDVMMPRLDGFGLLRAVRGDPALRELPVVLLSARAGEEARVDGLDAGADDYLTKPFSTRELLARVRANIQLARVRRETSLILKEEARTLETLNRVGMVVAAELDLDRTVQVVTDAATALTGAAFGAFFYNALDERGEHYLLYALSGAPREAFGGSGMPRNTAIFAPTFAGQGVVRSDDITKDPRYGHNPPHHGMPEGHLPVRSYLAVPVVARSGEVLGGLFFGHPEAGVFAERAERLVVGIAAQAAIAIDNARLHQAAQKEIGERRETEAALRASEARYRELTETLEMRVAARTRELQAANVELWAQMEERQRAEEALRQAQKMETIGQMTGGIAHDFNNLLTIIMGNMETLQRQLERATPDRARLKRASDNALRGARRAASLTQRLLAFSRRQPLDPKPVDINKLVAGMSELLTRTLGEQVALETVLAGGLWRTHADPNQIEAAILNLAINARDAMPQGGKLTIETANTYLDGAYSTLHAEVAPGQYVVICVTDSGIGMSREVAARAFEPFFTTKDVGHGTGLGLSQVYGFVKQSGGHVKIYSELGQGTTVKVYLPRLLVDEPSVEPSYSVEDMPTGEQSETVLVVEDDLDVRAHSTEILRELGYRVLEAASGPAALEMLDRHDDVALLFTDIGLPGGMNGRQLAEEAQRRRPGLKVLFTTAYAQNAIVHDGRLDPNVHLLTKPFTYADLAAKVRDLLDSESGPPSVLLVEDDFLVSLMVVEILEELGCRVEKAMSAAEATAAMGRSGGRIDAAVVDIGLPDKRGDDLAAELRAMDATLPIVIATGYDEGELRARFGGDRLVRFLGKPYDPARLIAALRALGVRGLGT